MSEHKINEGDMVTTKPMKAWLNFDDAATVKVTMHSGRIEWFNRADLIPIPATDAEVVEPIWKPIADAPKDREIFVRGPKKGGGEYFDCQKWWRDTTPWAVVYMAYAEGPPTQFMEIPAIAALTSSGYTRSPQPDVNQMMLEALKDAKDCIEAWSSYASDYFKEKHDLKGDLARIDAAIAAGSEG